MQESDTNKDQDALIQYSSQLNIYRNETLTREFCLEFVSRRNESRSTWLFLSTMIEEDLGLTEQAAKLRDELNERFPAILMESCPERPAVPMIPDRLRD